MEQARTITASIPVWVNEYTDPTRLVEQDPAHAVGMLTYYAPRDEDDWAARGYTKVGEAEVTVRLLDRDTLITSKVEALRAEKTRTLADAQARATVLEQQIQSLLAIEYTPEVA